jgi:hypothetical protein
MSNLAIRVILLGAVLCLAIPSLLRLQYLNRLRRRSTRAGSPYPTRPIPVRAKTMPPLQDAELTSIRKAVWATAAA